VRAQPDELLDEAREALADDALERARSLARMASEEDPGDPDAQVVLGLVAVRSGDPETGLSHFDRALGLAGGARAAIAFNRAVCLFELGRFSAAERAFLQVADDAGPPLSGLAAVNAGFAAREQGAPLRARRHLQRARTLDTGDELGPLLDELEAELQETLRALRAEGRELLEQGRDAEAVQRFERALKLAPRDGSAHYDAGVAAYRVGARDRARRHLRRARELGLDPDWDALAVAYLDVLSGGLRRAGRGPSLGLSVAGGYDSNVTQVGLGDSNALVGLQQTIADGTFVRATVDASHGFAPTDRTFALLSYGAYQLAYTDPDLDIYSTQVHDLEMAAEVRPTGPLRLGVSAFAAVTFIGLSDYRVLSWTGGGEARVGLVHGDGFDTEVRAQVSGTDAIADEFTFLAGNRFEAGLRQVYRQRRYSLGFDLRYRVENVGTQRIDASLPNPAVPPFCIDFTDPGIFDPGSVLDGNFGGSFDGAPPDGTDAPQQCPDIDGTVAIPLAYDGPGLSLWGQTRLASWLRVGGRAFIEWRLHRGQTGAGALGPFGFQYFGQPRTQRDVRSGLGADVTAELWGPLELTASYGLLVGSSNIDNTRGEEHAYDYANLNFIRHLVDLSLSLVL
jgi:tetratricopeptide (TPR) repeat protein